MTFLLIYLGVVGLLLLAVGVLLVGQGLSPEQKELRKLKKMLPKKEGSASEIGDKLYSFLRRVPLVKRLLRNMRVRLEILNVWEERGIKLFSSIFTIILTVVALLYLLIVLFINVSVYTKMSLIFLGVVLWTILMNGLVKSLKIRMLKDLLDIISVLKFSYHQSKMVSEALIRASEESRNNLGSLHFKKISDILLSLEPETEILSYYDVAPNTHLKKLADISLSVQTYGEDENTGMIYLEALQGITEDIQIDILKHQKLKQRTFGTLFMASSPAFAVELIRVWAVSNFPDLNGFYDSSLGFYVMVFLYLLMVICVFGVIMAKDFGESDVTKVSSEGMILKRLLRIPQVYKLMSRIAPEHGKTLKSHKILKKSEPLLRGAGSKLTVKELYLKKILFAVLVFVITIAVQLGAHNSVKQLLLDKTAELLPETTTNEYITKQERLFRAEAIKVYGDKPLTNQELYEFIVEDIGTLRFIREYESVEQFVLPLIEDIRKYQTSYYKWHELLVALFAAWIGFNSSNWTLLARRRLRTTERQNEVDGFYSLLGILSKFENVMVVDILERMHRYSVVFRAPLERCILDYESGPEDALARLKMDSRFPPMQRLVERLESAGDLPLSDVFSDLSQDRSFAVEQRKLGIDSSIQTRSTWCNLFGWTPLGSLIIFYLLLPVGIMMFSLLGPLSTVL